MDPARRHPDRHVRHGHADGPARLRRCAPEPLGRRRRRLLAVHRHAAHRVGPHHDLSP